MMKKFNFGNIFSNFVTKLPKIGNLIKPAFTRSKKESGQTGIKQKLSAMLPKKRILKKPPAFLQDFNWEHLITQLFSPTSRTNIHRIFIICLTAGATYMLGKIIAIAVTSNTPSVKIESHSQFANTDRANYKNEIEEIRRANLFNARKSEKDIVTDLRTQKVVITDTDTCSDSKRKSSLPLKLVNTIVLQDSVKSLASVQVRSEKDLLEIREGDKIQDIAKIAVIESRKVILRNLKTGECEHIENLEDNLPQQRDFTILPPDRGQQLISSVQNNEIVNEGNQFTIKKSLRDKMLENTSELLTQAKAITIQNPDGSLAFKMTDIVPGSIYSKLNIQDGDIITGIDGKKIQNLNEVMNYFGRIRDIDTLQIAVQRNGAEEKLEYNFED